MNDPTAAASAPNASCARCGRPFRCGADDPGPCACTGLALAPELLVRLREQYTGCLCLGCLHALAAEHEARCASLSARPLVR